MLNVKIRLQGTSERLEEAIRRLGIVFDIAEQSSLYPSKYGMDTRLCYLKVYMRCPRDGNLYDFNEALKLEIQDFRTYALTKNIIYVF